MHKRDPLSIGSISNNKSLCIDSIYTREPALEIRGVSLVYNLHVLTLYTHTKEPRCIDSMYSKQSSEVFFFCIASQYWFYVYEGSFALHIGSLGLLSSRRVLILDEQKRVSLY